ncbi:hypothetical protein [Paraburkholderia terricola]|uniref:hypothetical protein n=1 Tax=Paraburkholderia terricola TaxID=169427 RepID=UPI003ECF4CAD
MKYLPLIALTVAISACAAQPPAGVQSVGQSQQAPKAVATCIAQKWADGSQQQVVSQDTLANDQAVDVYVPGQQPPNGAAAVVRPSYSGKGSWVGFRASGAASSDATSAISACL